jgi:O-methyltransferase involved in polyketide biosynthesis
VPTPAGVYDFALGGTANNAADRAMVEHSKREMPHIVEGAWANRGFLQRAVKVLAGELGIRQFVDLGSGYPTQRNTHQVVAEQRADGRVVYVDVDPRVIAMSVEMLAGADGVACVLGDLRRPDEVLADPGLNALIDFTEPVAVLAVGVTHFLPDEDDPWGVVARYVDAVPSGSYLALSSITADRQEERWEAVKTGDARYRLFARTRAEVDRFFRGLEIHPPYPGAAPEVVHVGLWGAEDPELADDDGSRLAYAAVARKP